MGAAGMRYNKHEKMILKGKTTQVITLMLP